MPGSEALLGNSTLRDGPKKLRVLALRNLHLVNLRQVLVMLLEHLVLSVQSLAASRGFESVNTRQLTLKPMSREDLKILLLGARYWRCRGLAMIRSPARRHNKAQPRLSLKAGPIFMKQ